VNEDEARQYKKMILTPPGKLVFTLAVPTVISMLITMVYNLVDAYFVGKINTSASAAIGIVMSVQSVFQAFGFMYGQGSGSKVARLLAAGKKEEADKTLTLGVSASLLSGVFLTLMGFVFLDALINSMATATIFPYAKTYATYILISGPVLAMSCVLNNVLRYEGRAFFAMFGLVSGGILNMALDPILMFNYGLGIKGAAIATMVSQIVSLGILLYMFLSHRAISSINLSYLKLPASEIFGRIFEIVKTGFPSLLRQLCATLSTMVLNACSKPYGDAAIAAMTIDGRVLMFIGSTMIGIGQGFQPVSAFNYGSRKYKRVREACFATWRAGTILMTGLAVLGFIFSAEIIRVFRDDDMVVYYGIPALRFMCIAVVVQPISVVGNMLFQSIGEARKASILSMLRSGLCYIPLLVILPLFMGFLGIQCSQMCADILSALISVPFLIGFFKGLPGEDMHTEQDDKYEEYSKNEPDIGIRTS